MRNALLVPLLAAALACGSSGSGTPANGTDGGACPTASTGTL